MIVYSPICCQKQKLYPVLSTRWTGEHIRILVGIIVVSPHIIYARFQCRPWMFQLFMHLSLACIPRIRSWERGVPDTILSFA